MKKKIFLVIIVLIITIINLIVFKDFYNTNIQKNDTNQIMEVV